VAQHTNVSCSWDSGELDREKKLTNISAWKQLGEGDLQQYVGGASSDEDEDEGDAEQRRKR
jgi:hypothetical protein